MFSSSAWVSGKPWSFTLRSSGFHPSYHRHPGSMVCIKYSGKRMDGSPECQNTGKSHQQHERSGWCGQGTFASGLTGRQFGWGGVRRSFPEAEPRLALPHTLSTS